MTHVLLLILTYVAVVLDTAAWGLMEWPRPSALCIVAAAAIWTVPGSRAVVWCLLIGLTADALGSGPIGARGAVGAICGWWLSGVRLNGRIDSAPAFFLMTAGLTAILCGLGTVTDRLFARTPLFDATFAKEILLSASLTGTAGTVLLIFVRAIVPHSSRSAASPR